MAPSSNPSTLSTREQFQESVRSLNCEDIHRHKRNQSISLQYNPYELRHVSSLRVSPARKSAVKAEPTSLRRVVEEPDFGIQERDVWSRSPSDRAQRSQASKFILHEDATASPSQQRGHERDLPPLKPSRSDCHDSNHRPRTRHGPIGVSAFEEMANAENDNDTDENAQSIRQPKFIEGTMTSRSSATASTWSDSEYATSDSEAGETDSEATPKAFRKRSSSFDLRDFQPPALTPSAIKRTLFGKREAKKDKGDTKSKPKQKQEGEDKDKKPKKRLRKSMSKLQFLGEKMKIFGPSSQDLPEQTQSHIVRNIRDEKSILDERKRKAEAAYAEQLGSKKQRDNDGLANVTSSPDMLKEMAAQGNQKFDSSTVRARSNTTRSRRLSTGSLFAEPTSRPQSSSNEHDIRKRPSRRELEKENQQLRALLRESQCFKEQELTYTSESESIPPVPPLRIRRSLGPTIEVQMPSDEDPVAHEEPVDVPPPVPPQHPDRRVLSNVSNSRSRRTRRESFGTVSDSAPKERVIATTLCHPLNNTPKLIPSLSDKVLGAPRPSMPALPRSVSIIVEEPEGELDEKKRSLRRKPAAAGKENTVLTTTIDAAGRKEEWQWPDDVF